MHINQSIPNYNYDKESDLSVYLIMKICIASGILLIEYDCTE